MQQFHKITIPSFGAVFIQMSLFVEVVFVSFRTLLQMFNHVCGQYVCCLSSMSSTAGYKTHST